MGKIKLSILDQSIVRSGATARQAIDETIATAKLAEELGFYRIWVSEHHNSTMVAGSTPEVLMVKLADATKHIRIGSGGIMLPNHSAYKVAENFRMLETLFPGRIDLGMGRAPGTDRITSTILNPSNNFSETSYLEQLKHLQYYFTDAATSTHGPIIAAPQAPTIPMQWILSSSGGSSLIAAKFGLGLAVAKFINGLVTAETVDAYRRNFEPSEQLETPQALLAIFTMCAETEALAAEMRKTMDYVLLQFEKGNFTGFPDPAVVKQYQFSSAELERIKFLGGRIISGTKDKVKEDILALATEFDVDEIMVSTMANSAADRQRSFELLAEAFELTTQHHQTIHD